MDGFLVGSSLGDWRSGLAAYSCDLSPDPQEVRNGEPWMSVIYVTAQGTKLRLRAGRYVVCREEEELSSVPQASVEAVVLLGCVQVTTQAVLALLEAWSPLI